MNSVYSLIFSLVLLLRSVEGESNGTVGLEAGRIGFLRETRSDALIFSFRTSVHSREGAGDPSPEIPCIHSSVYTFICIKAYLVDFRGGYRRPSGVFRQTSQPAFHRGERSAARSSRPDEPGGLDRGRTVATRARSETLAPA